jgi:hypothetical protein
VTTAGSSHPNYAGLLFVGALVTAVLTWRVGWVRGASSLVKTQRTANLMILASLVPLVAGIALMLIGLLGVLGLRVFG